MSSTTTTQYYGLTQYIGTDKPDWADNNEAFREVDADLHEAVQSMEGFGTDIAALQEAQSELSTDVTGLESDLNTEKAKITALQNKETLQDAEIAGVKADALDMITAVDEGTAQVATVAVSEGKYFRYNDVLYIATTNIAVGDTIVPNTNCRATNVGTELEAQAEDIAEVKSDLANVNKNVTIHPDAAWSDPQCYLTKNNKMCEFDYETMFSGGTPFSTWFVAVTLPEDSRPAHQFSVPAIFASTGENIGECAFMTNGEVKIRVATGSVPVPAFVKVHAMFLTN